MAFWGNLKSQVNMLLFVDTDGFQIDAGCISSFSRSLFFKEICYKVSNLKHQVFLVSTASPGIGWRSVAATTPP